MAFPFNFLRVRNRWILLAFMWLVCMQATRSNAQNVVYKPLYTSSTFSNPIILSKPVDVIAGIVGVTPTGAATYTIPIEIPAGTNGVAPSLSLVYNSQSGNGMMGMGWSLSGLSAITRVNKDIFHDGKTDAVNYIPYEDVYALDGNRMILASGTYGVSGSTYRLEMDNFSVISGVSQKGSGPAKFSVETKDGTIMEYGYTVDSKFLTNDNNHVMVWYLSKVKDVNGNYILYNYETIGRELRLKEIWYTGNDGQSLVPYNKIEFNYLNKFDPNYTFQCAYSFEQLSLLTTIRVFTNNVEMHEYSLEYGKDGENSVLQELKLKSSLGNSLNSTEFLYYGSQPHIVAPAFSSANGEESVFSLDFNGDGVSDILQADNVGSAMHPYYGEFNLHTRNYSNSQFTTANYWLPVNINGSYKTNINSAGDINGDGMDDIVSAQCRYITDEIFDVESYNIFFGNSTSTLVASQPMPAFLTKNSGTGNGLKFSKYKTSTNFINIGDFNGDRSDDILAILGISEVWYQDFRTFIFDYKQNTTKEIIGLTIDASQNAENAAASFYDAEVIRPIDINGDGKSELFISS